MLCRVDVADIVQHSRERQGLSPTVSDPATLGRIAELVGLRPAGKDTPTTTAGQMPVPVESPSDTRATCKGAEGWERKATVQPDQGVGTLAALSIGNSKTTLDGDAGSLVALTGADDLSSVSC